MMTLIPTNGHRCRQRRHPHMECRAIEWQGDNYGDVLDLWLHIGMPGNLYPGEPGTEDGGLLYIWYMGETEGLLVAPGDWLVFIPQSHCYVAHIRQLPRQAFERDFEPLFSGEPCRRRRA